MSKDIDVPGGPVTEQLSPDEVAERTRAAVGYNYEFEEKYVVSREKIHEFANASQLLDPVHHDVEAARAAGYADIVAPPIMFSLIGIIAHRPLFENAIVGYGRRPVMQTEQKAQFHAPIVAGMILTTHVHFDSFRQIAGVDLITTRNEISDQDGNHLVTSWTTLAGRSGEDEDAEFVSAMEKVMMYGAS
ncbi:acyl dehydratase [Tsukamurella asaccharolytica]|uniref:Acyl dehydratase n=1 Tax=Tsukamurella asaccharolytica TaxID=2592067 RepID=A0A5C5RCS4_9ACTN|nr:(3R)-hydroxyacyl-ACP dehydratase subunit HadA [Tsukamurella asaccharolytica]TWS20422.1 acyl dehydratase [Tsukamurella asaccharolytica]